MEDSNKAIIFTLTDKNILIGYGIINSKVIVFHSDVDRVVDKDKKIVVKLIDYMLYKHAIGVIFKANPIADEVYIFRTDKDTYTEDCLYITREEHELLRRHYRGSK